jgi:hypothetical protein
MKRIIPVLMIAFIVSGICSCTKKSEGTAVLCDNGVKDGNENEIDCGGACTPCPDKGEFHCTIDGVAGSMLYVTKVASGQVLAPSIRVAGQSQNGDIPFNFMFIPSALNTPLPINASTFNYAGEPYTKGSGDTSTVIVTANDTLRHIISGTFSLGAQRIVGTPSRCAVSNGVFTNIRY